MRKRIRTFRESLKRYDVSYDCTLPQFLAQIESIVQRIPPHERDNIEVEWTDGDECDSGYIEFMHYRDETDAEMLAREAQEKASAEAQAKSREEQERRVYEALKQKYG